jgi:Tol biopolymer transport system component
MNVKCRATLFVGACGVSLLMHLRTFADDPPSPRLFAPGVISGPADDLSPAFTPDGNTVYFNRSNGTFSVMMVSTLSHGVWATPAVAPFSGKWNDIEPAISPDGSFLVFASNRPKDGRGTAIDGTFNGRSLPGGGGNLWRPMSSAEALNQLF